MAQIKIAIVEDEPLFRGLLENHLRRHPGLEVVGAYADGMSALASLPDIGPDVVTLDIEMPGRMDGIDVGLALRQRLPRLGIVILSNHADPRFLGALPREATSGWSYLLKKSVSDIETLDRAVEGAANGAVMLDPTVVAAMRPKPGGPAGAADAATAGYRRSAGPGPHQRGDRRAAGAGGKVGREPADGDLRRVGYRPPRTRSDGPSAGKRGADVSARESRRNTSDGRKQGMTEPRPGPRTLVLVDDQPEFLEIARARLTRDATLTVVGEATSGEAAVALVLQLEPGPEAVLVDVEMPGLDGFETARRLRAVAPGVRIILTSASSNSRLLRGGHRHRRRVPGQAAPDRRSRLAPTRRRTAVAPTGWCPGRRYC